MDINELKIAWDKFSAQEVDKHRLAETTIHELLKNRTQTLVDRIDRNIRIGMGLLGLYVVYLVIDYLFLSDYFSKIIMNRVVEYPQWLEPIDLFSTTLIIATYLFFVLRYFKTKRSFSVQLQLKPLLIGIRETLTTYRRLFYLAVIILFINILISYTAGVYEGLLVRAQTAGSAEISLSVRQILLICGLSIAIIAPLMGLSFFVLRWGYTKLYGQYLHKLTEALSELEESENED